MTFPSKEVVRSSYSPLEQLRRRIENNNGMAACLMIFLFPVKLRKPGVDDVPLLAWRQILDRVLTACYAAK
jgi:hypothetical protein